MTKIALAKNGDIVTQTPILNRESRRKLKLDTIKITGIVRILQNGKVVRESRNHFVNQGLLSLVSLLGCSASNGSVNLPGANWSANNSQSTMVLGTNTSAPTTASMTGLTSPIGAGIGTTPNTKSGVNGNPSAGVYQVTYLATWNAGTVSGTIGELGLYLCMKAGLLGFGATWDGNNLIFISRLSVADGDFAAYPIDTGLALTVQWIVRFSFA